MTICTAYSKNEKAFSLWAGITCRGAVSGWNGSARSDGGQTYLISLQIAPGKCANCNRKCGKSSTNYPAVTEPRRVDARPLRIDTRIGDWNRVAPRKPCDALLSRVHHPMRQTVGVLELEYRINLPGVPALEVNDGCLCLQGTGGRSLVAAVKQSASANETRGESQKSNESRHRSQRISGACQEGSDECPLFESRGDSLDAGGRPR